MVTPQELLAHATEFGFSTLGPVPVGMTDTNADGKVVAVRIRWCNETGLWAIRAKNWCWARYEYDDYGWDVEPINPAARTKGFLKRTRFPLNMALAMVPRILERGDASH